MCWVTQNADLILVPVKPKHDDGKQIMEVCSTRRTITGYWNIFVMAFYIYIYSLMVNLRKTFTLITNLHSNQSPNYLFVYSLTHPRIINTTYPRLHSISATIHSIHYPSTIRMWWRIWCQCAVFEWPKYKHLINVAIISCVTL